MALIRQFYSRKDDGDEGVSYSLARDVLTDNVFVLCCRTRRIGALVQDDETSVPLAEFLRGPGPAQSELLELIGSLVVEE